MPGEFDLEAYLCRVNFSGSTVVSADTLERLHHAHFHSIPFENFDVLLGRGIRLDPKALFDKLVLGKRGGYCFELNGLFLQALQAMGFRARPLLARDHVAAPGKRCKSSRTAPPILMPLEPTSA